MIILWASSNEVIENRSIYRKGALGEPLNVILQNKYKKFSDTISIKWTGSVKVL